jgi:hypothetical protein
MTKINQAIKQLVQELHIILTLVETMYTKFDEDYLVNLHMTYDVITNPFQNRHWICPENLYVGARQIIYGKIEFMLDDPRGA